MKSIKSVTLGLVRFFSLIKERFNSQISLKGNHSETILGHFFISYSLNIYVFKNIFAKVTKVLRRIQKKMDETEEV